jgi:circadian clock protein KaiC
MNQKINQSSRINSGISGLNELLMGGFIPLGAYLVRGGPGSGKTTLGHHFLTATDKPSLFITLSEDEQNIRRNAENIGFNLTNVHFLNLTPDRNAFFEEESYDIFSPAEVERKPLSDKLVSAIEKIKPERVFIDSLTQLRYLTTNSYQFRRQTLSLFSYLKNLNITTLFSSESSAEAPDDDLQFLADGIIQIENRLDGRMVRITKFRGSDFAQDWHFFRLTNQGWKVFPRMRPSDHVREFTPEMVPSGVPELDELLHGGLVRGTVTMISGPTGAGKTTLGLQYMKEAAGRGERSVIFSFEETLGTLFHRSRSIGIPIDAMVEQGTLTVHYVEPLRYSAFEFASMLRNEVESHQASIVMLDSSKGFQVSIRGENILTHLHTKCTYLKNIGVTTILISELDTVAGDLFKATEVGVSYLADTIVFLRYMELKGELHKAIGVLKNRTNSFERSIRKLEITPFGIKVGSPLTNVSGLLSGQPTLVKQTSAETSQ